jgi:hypothetical protein
MSDVDEHGVNDDLDITWREDREKSRCSAGTQVRRESDHCTVEPRAT